MENVEENNKNLLPSKEIAKITVKILDRRNATEIKALYVKELTILSDYFVIAKAGNNTHAKSLVSEIEKELEEKNIFSRARDGYNSDGWIVVDFGVVMVHVFFSQEGDLYQEALEKIWMDAENIDFTNQKDEKK